MTMLPRNMTSPMVSPSAGTGSIVSGSHHGQRLERGVARRPGAPSSGAAGGVERVPVGLPFVDDRRAVGLGQAVEMGDVEAVIGHGGEHRFGRRRGGGEELDRRGRARACRRRGVDRIVDMTIGAPHRWVTPWSASASYIGFWRTARRQTWVPATTDMRPREAPAVAVEHRQRPQIDRVLGHGAGQHVALGHQVGAAVVVDDALGIAGRAGGVVERDRVPFVVGHRPGEVGIALGEQAPRSRGCRAARRPARTPDRRSR